MVSLHRVGRVLSAAAAVVVAVVLEEGVNTLLLSTLWLDDDRTKASRRTKLLGSTVEAAAGAVALDAAEAASDPTPPRFGPCRCPPDPTWLDTEPKDVCLLVVVFSFVPPSDPTELR